jgi:hypothetical protein
MNSYRLCLRAVIVGALGVMVAATSACGSSSGGSSTAAGASISSAPITSEAVATQEPTTAPDDTEPVKKPKTKAGTASDKAVCKVMEPSVSKILNGAIENDQPSERPKLNKIFKDVADDAREQADRASNAKLSAALLQMADATEAFSKVENLATAEKEGAAFQRAVRKVGPFCGA